MTDPTQTGGQVENPRAVAMRQIAQQVQDSAAGDMADFDEDSGQITPREQPQEERVAEAGEDTAQALTPAEEPAPAASAPRMLTIIVDGQPIEVEESRIIEAGKRTLQKDNAADRRLQEAAQLKRQYEAQLSNLRASSDPAQYEAPSQDAPQQYAQTTPVDPEALRAFVKNELYGARAEDALATFTAEFKDIVEDPHLLAIAARLEDQRLTMAARLGEPLGNPVLAYRKHGETIRKWMAEKAGGLLPVAANTDKADRKRTITAVPAANARSPAPQAEKVLTVAQQIEEIRANRGRGRPVPQRIHR